MFQVKICGITRPADAASAALAGADAIGLNFCDTSPRCLSLSAAETVVSELPSSVLRVGVFVNAPVDEMLRIAERLQLGAIQLHGDEPPEVVRQLAGWAVIRAVRLPRAEFDEVGHYLARCRELDAPLAALLVDAYQAGVYGGTGHTADWQLARQVRDQFAPLPVVLAGGLRPENVAEAVAAVRPAGVDTASGVESAPGIKDPEKIRRFVEAARAAAAQPGR